MNPRTLAVSSSMFFLLACTATRGGAASELVYLTAPEGKELFMFSEEQADYFPLASYLEFEQVLTFCGPASIAAVLNSLDVARPSPQRLYPYGLFTQDLVFSAENQAIKSYATVEKEGLFLPDIAAFLENLGVTAEHRYAEDFTVVQFREALVTTLRDSDKRLIVNYSRSGIGQVGGGHISPLAAYDVDSDRVLILDVAKYKHPPVWVTVDKLHKSMSEKDPASGKSRGIVIVSK